MSGWPHPTLDEEPASETQMAAELRKLHKINRVLMDRVERDMDAEGGNAFSLFQTAITLESKVTERTVELTRLTQRLMHEISERRLAEQALLRAKAEAEQANIGKTRFLAAASHDLHQPLNAARLFLGALAEEVAGERPRGLVERVEAALESVRELLDTLLDISRLDAGAWHAEKMSFPVMPLLARLADEYTPQAEACGLALRVVGSSAVLHTDRALFERILRNLICNAIRYTESGRVLIGCRPRGAGVRVEVWDTGIGIPADKLGDVFEEFGQLGNNPRREDKGVGLGLAIVDRIAQLLDVKVDVASRVGHGSCFSVTVPAGEIDDAAVHAIPLAADPAGLAGRVVAVVDRDSEALRALTALLENWGCRPVAANCAGAVLRLLEAAGLVPDLIVADHLPADGTLDQRAVAAVRARFGTVPGLIVSWDRSPGLKAEARALGYALIGKPASPAKLRSMLSYLLSRPPEAAESA